MLDDLPRALCEDLRLRRVVEASPFGGLRLVTDGRPLADLLALFEVPEIAQLPIRELVATKTLTASVAAELAASPTLARFTRLNVIDVKLGAGLGVILASPHARGLRDLAIQSTGCAADALRVLAGSEIALESLLLADTALGDEPLATYLRSPAAQSLRTLTNHRVVSPELLQSIAQSPSLSGLRALALYKSKVGDLAPLVEATFHALERLELRDAPLSSSAIATLGKASFAKSLTDLGLGGTRIDDSGLGKLARSGLRLRRLDLARTKVYGPGVRALGEASSFADLTSLHLDCGRSVHAQGDRAAEALAAFPQLTELSLRYAALSDAGVASISRLPALRHLDLAGAGITAPGAAALAQAPFAPHLEALNLEAYPGDPKLGPAGGAALGRGAFAALRTLNLRNQAVGDASIPALGSSLPSLASLDLSSCGLTAVGCAALGKAAFTHTLEKLDLSFNAVGEGVAAFSSLVRLRRLTMAHAGLDEAAVVQFLNEAPWTLREIDLDGGKQLGDATLAVLIVRASQLVEVSGRLGAATDAQCRALVAALKPPSRRAVIKRWLRSP